MGQPVFILDLVGVAIQRACPWPMQNVCRKFWSALGLAAVEIRLVRFLLLRPLHGHILHPMGIPGVLLVEDRCPG